MKQRKVKPAIAQQGGQKTAETLVPNLTPEDVERLIGEALFGQVAHQLFLECDRPFDLDGKLTRDGHEIAVHIMGSALACLSKDIDDYMTYRVVDIKMKQMEIPFA